MPLSVLCPARPSSPVSGRSTPIVIVLAAGGAGAARHAGAAIRHAATPDKAPCRPGAGHLGAPHLKIETGEHLKPRSQYADEAVQLAIAGKWDEAVKLNKFIVESFGGDEETQNRLGKALSELGKLKDAKAAYELALKHNPMNSIAKKNAARLNTLLHQKEGLKVGGTKVDLNLFVEEMGKTIITALEGAS